MESKGLGQIVVGASIQTYNLILDGCPDREEKDGRFNILIAKLPENAKAIHFREIDVQNDQVMDPIEPHDQTCFSIGNQVNRIAFLLKTFPDETGNLLFVFHHKKPH